MLRSFFQLLSRANQLIRSKSSNGKSGINVFSILTFLSLDNAIPFHFDQVGRRDATTGEEVQYRALGK